jgi:hypothetical protein
MRRVVMIHFNSEEVEGKKWKGWWVNEKEFVGQWKNGE